MNQLIISRYSDIPIAYVLEGGYNIESLVKSVDLTLQELTQSSS